MTEPSKHFDSDRFISVYRDVIRDRDDSKVEELRIEFDQIAERLRAIWKYWKGADTLHQTAFEENGF